MNRRIFSRDEIAELLRNRNVVKCSAKTITYAKGFKIAAIRQYLEEGLTSTEIFKKAGFDLHSIGKDIPKDRIRDWLRVFKADGITGLRLEARGRSRGRPNGKGLSDTDKIKWLEAKVAYLKAENDYLVKLRAKRSE